MCFCWPLLTATPLTMITCAQIRSTQPARRGATSIFPPDTFTREHFIISIFQMGKVTKSETQVWVSATLQPACKTVTLCGSSAGLRLPLLVTGLSVVPSKERNHIKTCEIISRTTIQPKIQTHILKYGIFSLWNINVLNQPSTAQADEAYLDN